MFQNEVTFQVNIACLSITQTLFLTSDWQTQVLCAYSRPWSLQSLPAAQMSYCSSCCNNKLGIDRDYPKLGYWNLVATHQRLKQIKKGRGTKTTKKFLSPFWMHIHVYNISILAILAKKRGELNPHSPLWGGWGLFNCCFTVRAAKFSLIIGACVLCAGRDLNCAKPPVTCELF